MVIKILSQEDFLHPDLWCRPLYFTCGDFGGMEYYQTGNFGDIINNFKWIKVTEIFSDTWLDGIRQVKELESFHYEFIEGDPPEEHCTTKKEVYKYD